MTATGLGRREVWGNNPDNTPEEISSDILACLEAGASIVHNHNDDPNFGGTGRHDAAPYLKAWQPVLTQRPDAILYPTMEGGGPHTPLA